MSDSFLKRFGRTILAVLTAFLLAACSGGGGGNSGAPGGPGGNGNGCSVGVPTSFTQWTGTKQLGVAGQDTWANAVAVDATDDSVYVAGITRGALDCVPITSGAAAFLTKYDSFGNRLFTRLLNSTVPDFTASDAVEAQALAIDSNGNVYVAGYTFTGADGNALIGHQDFFLTKYDSSGNELFTREFGVPGAFDTEAFAIAVDSVNRRVYVAGDTNGGLDGHALTGDVDYFFTAYDLDGIYQFTVQKGAAGSSGSSNSSAYSAAVDASGNLYLAGGTTVGLVNPVATGTQDFFLLKFGFGAISPTTGTQLGVSAKSTYAAGVAVDPSGANWYVAGATSGGLDGNSPTGTEDFFLTPYSGGGTKGATSQFGAIGVNTYAAGVALDTSGNAYVAGYTDGGLDANTLMGVQDFFLAKFNSLGNKVSTKQLGVAGAITFAYGVATDSFGNVYVAGGTSGGLDGNTVTGTTDFFVTKYDSLGIKQ